MKTKHVCKGVGGKFEDNRFDGWNRPWICQTQPVETWCFNMFHAFAQCRSTAGRHKFFVQVSVKHAGTKYKGHRFDMVGQFGANNFGDKCEVCASESGIRKETWIFFMLPMWNSLCPKHFANRYVLVCYLQNIGNKYCVKDLTSIKNLSLFRQLVCASVCMCVCDLHDMLRGI